MRRFDFVAPDERTYDLIGSDGTIYEFKAWRRDAEALMTPEALEKFRRF